MLFLTSSYQINAAFLRLTISSGGRLVPFTNAVLASVLLAIVVVTPSSKPTDTYQNPKHNADN